MSLCLWEWLALGAGSLCLTALALGMHRAATLAGWVRWLERRLR